MKNNIGGFCSVFVLSFWLIPLVWGCAGNSSSPSKPVEPIESQNTVSKTNPPSGAETTGQNVKIANPASVNCIENGGKLEIRDGEGGQYGICIFEDGSRCEEWSFFRKKCSPGSCREASGICKDDK